MIGGTEEANFIVQFWQSNSPQVDSSPTWTEFFDVFYKADISGYDLIFGCPLMVNNTMGPWPHRRCLVIECEDNLFEVFPRSQGDVSAAETMPPYVPPDVLLDGPRRWITSSDTIKSEDIQTVLQHFNCPTPTLDAFASAANHQFPRHWIEMDSSWQRFLSKDFIWASPPLEWLKQVVRMFISDKAQGIILLPDCSSTCPSKGGAYCGALDSITLADYTFRPHTKLLFSKNGKALGPTPWKVGTRAVWVKRSLDSLPSEVDIARISAVGFRYEEDTDLMMPIWSPKFRNQSVDDAVSTILAQLLDKDFVSAQPSPTTANDAIVHSRGVM